ncbi:GGDEF domain-containing protein [Petroclostridium sp. X23]|uniref:GGDEF domain-containing protein n=1 Tax=Petroclostridium sp. X23 TaxID=3045146 RepID=UPI0024AE0308|nr:GGDEF domain-containing protein [Petroclostridium sp. X23]WHH59239.1 GGDEF domain-containing protein [Petroclostridium sp. X23]
MDNFFIRFSPLILPFKVFSLHAFGCIITLWVKDQYVIPIWLSMALIDAAFASKYGSIIQELYNNSYKDALTGIQNRRCFYMRIIDEMEKVRTRNTPLSLLMIDIDNFKPINDTYGHDAGDEVLKQIAAVLKENVKNTETLSRWGGEEFTILLPDTNVEDAMKFADKIRSNIWEHRFKYEDITIKLTISIGVASINEVMDIGQFIKVADSALYKAKEKKNFVERLGQAAL